jgi:ABC-type transporter Mla subunit MlaD
MIDPIISSAECDALREQLRIANSRIEEFERAATDYPPSEHPTRPDAVADVITQAWSQAKSASTLLDTVIEHLRGKADGLEVSVSQLQSSHDEVMSSLEAINSMLQEHGRALKAIGHTLTIAVNEGRNNSERISLLELSKTLPTIPPRVGME